MKRPAAEPPVADAETAPVAVHPHRRRARFELIFASAWFAVGLFLMPAMIFSVGGALLGPYGDDGGLGRFYGDFFGDLAEPSVRAWAIALGPLVLISLLRLVFAGAGRSPPESSDAQERPETPRRSVDEPRRVEPRVSID